MDDHTIIIVCIQTHASKSSLQEETHRPAQDDVLSSIYSMIRDYAARRNADTIEYAQVEDMVTRKGHTPQQLRDCLLEYQHLGVLHLDVDRRFITIDV